MNRLLVLTLILLLYSCSNKVKEVKSVSLSPITEKALYDIDSRFYANFKEFPAERAKLPIGVFDSGTGGLTVLEVLLSIDEINNITGKMGSDGIPDFAGEDFTYFGDFANMPYGMYPYEKKEDYLKELVVKDALFLLDDQYYNPAEIEQQATQKKNPSKIIVVACNTATAYGLEEIELLLKESKTGIKVIGVIDAGVKAFYDILTSNVSKRTDSVAVGVLATLGTIASNAYEEKIVKGAKGYGYENLVKVINHGGLGFAEAVDQEYDYIDPTATGIRDNYRGPVVGEGENDININLLSIYNFDYTNNGILIERKDDQIKQIQLNSAKNYAKFHIVSLIEKHRKSGSKVKLESIILGCTHYPFLIDELYKAVADLRMVTVENYPIYRSIIHKDLTFIDPAVYTAIECYKSLREDRLLSLSTEAERLDAYISIPAPNLLQSLKERDNKLKYEFKYGREVGSEEITTIQVPFSRENLTDDVLKRIEIQLPHSYKKIKKLIN